MPFSPIFAFGFAFNGVGNFVYLLYMGKLLHGFANGVQHTACASYYSEVTSSSILTTVHCIAGVFNCVACAACKVWLQVAIVIFYVGIVLGFIRISEEAIGI